jgi:chromosome segregation protein
MGVTVASPAATSDACSSPLNHTMHIRKLELQGFKSFPNRTSFHFGTGVSGVVGPNGCGKSNVVDAVKWCLGEQSAKSLRGRSMDDIIFAGSDSRKPMGIAEVSLTFEAGSEPFAGEFARCEEIQITRRLFRDGGSEYLINQQRCRLKDIQDIFRDTGASNRLYSFIEQGRIGEIIKAKPEQRRSLIEEAAGISRFKAKKRETELRLEGTNRNLERATDLVEDLSTRLRSLRRQVSKATRYRRLRTEVKQGEVFLGLARYAGLVGDRRVVAERLRSMSATELAKRRELERQDEEIGAKRGAVEVLEGALGGLRDELGELEATRRERESARMYQGRESAQLTERIERLGVARVGAERELKVGSERRATAQAEHDAVDASAALVRTQVDETAAAADVAEAQVQTRRAGIETSKAEVLDLVRALARDQASKEASRLRREDNVSRIADLGFRVQVSKDAVGDQAAALAAAQAADRSTQDALETAMATSVTTEAALGAARDMLSQARTRRREAEAALMASERAAGQARGRLESLEALAAANDGIEEHAKRALQVEGVLGTLADHLDVPAHLETLVATAIGDELEYVLVPDADTAIRVAEATQGRVSMLLLGDAAELSGPLGDIGSSDIARSALNRILGNCTEVADLDEAIGMVQEGGGACIVPRGPGGLPVVLSARGEIRIGPAKTNATMVLQRRRELGELQRTVPELEAVRGVSATTVEQATVAQDAASAALEEAQQVFNAARQHAAEARLAQRESHAERTRIEKRNAESEQQLSALATELTALTEMMDRLDVQQHDLSGAITSAQAAQVVCEERLHEEQQALVEEEGIARDRRSAAVVAKMELAGVDQRLQGLAQMVDVARQTEDSAARQVATCSRDIDAAKTRITALSTDDQRLTGALEQIGEAQSSIRAKIDVSKIQIAEAREALLAAEESVRGLRDEREAATAERMDLEREIDQIKGEIAQIRAQLDERYQISVTGLLDRLERNGQILVEVPEEARPMVAEPEASASPEAPTPQDDLLEDLCIKPSMLENVDTIAAWVTRLNEAKHRLERLGEVNLVAVQEYAEVKGRFDTLDGQRADLEESVRAIRSTLAQLNRTCRERFRETFERVNALFQEGYPKLVGGGRARLVLTDEEDMLETGVDIEVQPPGKRLQNLALLSGGEMAMTAIALIFALFQVKPSPFCLLDEVDAPLDEANGARFNNLLREMANLSQFIVITHNKKTMECVDTLYGVTMPNAGVSQLVSVKLD